MFTVSIDPFILSVGHFALRWYSLLLLTAIGVGIWLTAREAERRAFKKLDCLAARLVFSKITGCRCAWLGSGSSD